MTAPFDSKIVFPSTGKLGESFAIQLEIFNRLFTVERLVVKVILQESMLVTGYTNHSVEVGPLQATTLTWVAVPLETGHIMLPHITVSWQPLSGSSASGTGIGSGLRSVVDVSNHANNPRYVFVRP